MVDHAPGSSSGISSSQSLRALRGSPTRSSLEVITRHQVSLTVILGRASTSSILSFNRRYFHYQNHQRMISRSEDSHFCLLAIMLNSLISHISAINPSSDVSALRSSSVLTLSSTTSTTTELLLLLHTFRLILRKTLFFWSL